MPDTDPRFKTFRTSGGTPTNGKIAFYLDDINVALCSDYAETYSEPCPAQAEGDDAHIHCAMCIRPQPLEDGTVPEASHLIVTHGPRGEWIAGFYCDTDCLARAAQAFAAAVRDALLERKVEVDHAHGVAHGPNCLVRTAGKN